MKVLRFLQKADRKGSMQYITFLGTGGKAGYRTTVNCFEEDEKNLSNLVETKYVQLPIYQKHQQQISEILVFLTEEARRKSYPEFAALFRDVPITEIPIPDDISSEEFIDKLLANIKENGRAIFDVTHSFRYLPMKFLFALRYVEQMRNTSIEHVYYGLMKNQFTDNEYCVITDFLADYETQKISELLSQFNRSLTASAADWGRFVTKDANVERFLIALANFNDTLELSDFEASIPVARKITECARSLLKKPEKYTLLLPLAKKIEDKLQPVSGAIGSRKQKAALIELLLNHDRLQNAVTFTDQFLREELIRTAMPQISPKVSLENAAKSLGLPLYLQPKFVYVLSQYLRDCILLNKHEPAEWAKLEPYIDLSSRGLEKIRAVGSSADNKAIVDGFVKDVRNRINHGQPIKDKHGAETMTRNLLTVIQSL